MKTDPDASFDALERLFHEPSRLAILSALAAAPEGSPFTALRDACGLTDGNLSRHLKALEEARVVRIRKAFVRNRPQTTIELTAQGNERFSEYLLQLEAVLKAARRAVDGETPQPALGRTAKATA